MGTVLDDVTSEAADAQHVPRRVDDWEERVNALYAMIEDWLPDGWEARRGAAVVMHEPLMRKFGIGAKRMPTLELLDRAGHVAKLEPHALWIRGVDHRLASRAPAEGVRELEFAVAGASRGRVGDCRVGEPRNAATDAKKNGMCQRKIAYWVIPPGADAEFAAHMEEVLETYARPLDSDCPVLCMDEQPDRRWAISSRRRS